MGWITDRIGSGLQGDHLRIGNVTVKLHHMRNAAARGFIAECRSADEDCQAVRGNRARTRAAADKTAIDPNTQPGSALILEADGVPLVLDQTTGAHVNIPAAA